MSARSKQPSIMTPLERAAADFNALVDSMRKAAQPHIDRVRESHDRMLSLGERGDWESCDAEMDNWQAHHAAAIQATGAVTPTAKLSMGGKLSGSNRNRDADVLVHYDDRIASDRTHLQAIADCQVKFKYKNPSQIRKILAKRRAK